MEFPFNVNDCLQNEICLLRADDVTNHARISDNEKKKREQLWQIIDKMGEASAKAQKLHTCITSANKLMNSSHKVYILKGKNDNDFHVIGFIKIGYKRLFLMSIDGELRECDPLCVLDFYVHETQQRNGYGKKLFDFAIKSEGKLPHQVAIDRPSEKFLSFLSKHFKLNNPLYQINKFVVFEKFFCDLDAIRAVERRRSAPVRHNLFLHERAGERNTSSASSIRSKMSSRRSDRIKNSPLIYGNTTSFTYNSVNKHDSQVFANNTPNISLLNPSSKYLSSARHSKQPENLAHRNYSRHIKSPMEQPTPKFTNMKKESRTLPNVVTVNAFINDVQRDVLPSLDNPLFTQEKCAEEPSGSQQLTNVSSQVDKNKRSIDKDSSYVVENLVRGIADSKQRLGTSWNVFGVPSKIPYESHERNTRR